MVGLKKTDYRLTVSPKKSAVLLSNGLGRIVVASTSAELEPIATTGEP